MRRSHFPLLSITALLLATGCGDGSPSGPDPAAVTAVEIPSDSLTLIEDDSARVDAVARNFSGEVLDTTVSWRSLDPQVATVSATGMVRAVAPGVTDVVARIGELEDSIGVRVTVRAEEIIPVSGDDQAADPGETLPEPLTVRVIDRRGDGVPDHLVLFEVVDGGGSVDPEEVRTDAEGFARASWTLGPEIGEQLAQAIALEDTIRFSADALSDAATIEIEPDGGTIDVGEELQLEATAHRSDGSVVPAAIEWASSRPTVAAVDENGLVEGLSAGETFIIATAENGVRDSVQVTVLQPPTPACSPSNAVQLSVGEVVQFQGDAAGSLCLGEGEYVAIPFYASQASTARLAVRVEASGVTGVTGPPNPSRTPWAGARDEARRPDLDWEYRFRERERRQLESLLPQLRDRRITRSLTPNLDVAAVGDLLTLNTAASCSNPEYAHGRVVAVSDRAVIVADTLNPSGGFTSADYASVAEAVDTLIYPVNVEYFGEPTDLDDNSRILVFYTRAVNELTPPDSEGFVAGFFWAGDLLPVDTCPGSNYAEMFYMLAPDPTGELGNDYSRDFVVRTTLSTVGHELQHLINSARRIYINDANALEVVWLNEALSHVAEELLFYEVTPYGPRQNLGDEEIRASSQTVNAANRFLVSNLGRYIRYLQNPDTVSLLGADDLPTRGAGWAFLRYAADRRGGSDQAFFYSLVNSQTTGLTNLQQVMEASPLAWMQDWTVSVYADDAVPGTPQAYQQPSWNFRDVVPLITEGFPLRTTAITEGTRNFTIRAGGSIFARFGVPNGGAGALLWTSADTAPPPQLHLSIQRTR